MPVVPAPLPERLHGTTESLLGGLPFDNPIPLARLGPEVGESEKIECAVPYPSPYGGWLLEPNQRRLRRVYGQLEEIEAFWQCCHHPPGVVLLFAADKKIIGKTDQEASALQPGFDVPYVPPVKHVVEEDVTEDG